MTTRRSAVPDATLWRGFTLIELAVALVALGLIAIFALTLIPWVSERMRLDDTSHDLTEIRKSIDGFARVNHFLPCPDTVGDGLENRDANGICVNSVGGVPYRSLALSGQARDEAFRPLRYGVYRGPAADLTVSTQLFQPRLPDSLTITPGTVSGCSSDGDLLLVVFDSQASTVFRVQNGGGFEEGEYIGLGILTYDNLVTDQNASPCPCGGTAPTCTLCTVFPNGTIVQGAVSGDATTVSSTTVVGPPGEFHTTFPAGGFAMPEGIASTNPVGITADGLSFTRLLARVTAIDGNDLSVEVLESIGSSGFAVGQTVTGATAGDQATVTNISGVSINAEVVSGSFASGDTITNGTATATVNQSNPANYIAEVASGSISEGDTLTQDNTLAVVSVLDASDARVEVTLGGGSPTPSVGDTITGAISGATAVVASVSGTNVVGSAYGATPWQLEGVTIAPSGAFGTANNIVRQVSGQVISGTLNATDTLVGPDGTAEIIHAVVTPTITATEAGLIGNESFAVGMRVHGSSSGANSPIMEIIPPTAGMFAVGETVTTPTGSGVVQPGGVGASWVLLDDVTGTFSVGQTISGTTPGAGGEIIDVRDNQTVIPTAVAGSISRTSNVSTQLNNLDFCQNLRNAHIATVLSGSGSTGVVNTVSPDGPTINPAYLLVSGGVENADGVATDIAFDGLNRLAPEPLDFHSPGLGRGPVYDDIVTTMPIEQLEQRLQCAINIGAVNAKAANATTMKNNALLAFWLNEQAIRNVEVSYQAWQMAETDLLLAIFGAVLDTISTGLSLYKDLMYSEGAVGKKAFETAQFVIAAGLGITQTAISIADIVDQATSSVTSAKATFEDACAAQEATFAAVGVADLAAAAKLDEALRIDELGGVR